MNDDFEQHLRRQPVKQIPAEWRKQILAAPRPAPIARRHWFFSGLTFQLPAPMIRWAALAAVWVVIFGLNHAGRDAAPEMAAASASPSPQIIVALREQKKVLAELIGPAALSDAEKPKPFLPRPHSQKCPRFLNA
jgi:hypothetical protein